MTEQNGIIVVAFFLQLFHGCLSNTSCYVTSTGTVEVCKYSCCSIAGKSSCCNVEAFIIGGVSGGFVCMIIGIAVTYYFCSRPKQTVVRRISIMECGVRVLNTRQRAAGIDYSRPRGPPPPYPGQ